MAKISRPRRARARAAHDRRGQTVESARPARVPPPSSRHDGLRPTLRARCRAAAHAVTSGQGTLTARSSSQTATDRARRACTYADAVSPPASQTWPGAAGAVAPASASRRRCSRWHSRPCTAASSPSGHSRRNGRARPERCRCLSARFTTVRSTRTSRSSTGECAFAAYALRLACSCECHLSTVIGSRGSRATASAPRTCSRRGAGRDVCYLVLLVAVAAGAANRR